MGSSVAATTQAQPRAKPFYPHIIINDGNRIPVAAQHYNLWRRRKWKWRIVKASSSEVENKADQKTSSCREIRVCVNKACARSGSRETLNFVTGLAPPIVKVKSCGCLGHCGSGPNLVVLPAEIFVSHCSTASHAAHLLAIQCGASDPENNLTALSLKEQGNKEFESGNVVRAEQLFSQAINLNPSGGQQFLFSNRSAVRLAMGDTVSSLADAKEASGIAPNWHVACLRQGDAYFALGEYEAAEHAYLSALAIEPSLRRSKSFKGDSCNFIGCLLTGDQLITETITAAYFILSDFVILSQYLYYGYKGRSKQFGAYASDSDESLHKPPNGYYEALQNGTASLLDKILENSTAETVIETKRDTCDFCRLGANPDRQGPKIFTTIDSQKVSSGMYQTTVTNTDHSIPEDRSSLRHCSCAISRVDHLRANAACSSRSIGFQKHGQDCFFPTKKADNLQRVIMQYGLEYNIPSAVKSTKRHMLSSGKNSVNAALHVRKSRAKVAFCFTGLLILGTWSCHSLLGDPNFERNSVPNGNTVISLGRRSLKEVHREDQSFPQRLLGQTGSAPLWTRDIGRLVGWVSSVLYLSSRISQLLKNRSRKSAEGLSLGMVGCAMMANLTYGLAILMLTKSWGDLVGKAPWLVGSLGTVSLDFSMFIQAYYFRYRYGKITADECNPLLA